MSNLIKMYGERNTSTNYMSKLISLNLCAQEIPGSMPPAILALQNMLRGKEWVEDFYFYFSYHKNLGWKHTCVKPVDKLRKYDLVATSDIAFITITKNPYSWLLSLHRKPYHQYGAESLDFKTFLQRPWKTVGRDNTVKTLKSPIELWNIKNSSYIQLSKELRGLNITVEKILEDPEKVLDLICHHFSIEKRSDSFVNLKQSTKKNKSKDFDWYRDYYLSMKWRDEISGEEIKIINSELDKRTMSHFGYEFLQSTSV